LRVWECSLAGRPNPSIDGAPENQPTEEALRTLVQDGATGFVNESNVLSEEKQKQVIALGQVGRILRHIERETGVRRETADGYRGRGRYTGLPEIDCKCWTSRAVFQRVGSLGSIHARDNVTTVASSSPALLTR
jgi:hypothetical protein